MLIRFVVPVFVYQRRNWYLYYEWCMIASARAHDLEETVDDVEASPRELIGGRSKCGDSKIEYPKS